MTPLSATRVRLQTSILSKEYLLALLAITGLFLFLFGPSLQAKFYVIEDHILVAERAWGISDWIARIIGDIQSFARFRPGYWPYQAICVTDQSN